MAVTDLIIPDRDASGIPFCATRWRSPGAARFIHEYSQNTVLIIDIIYLVSVDGHHSTLRYGSITYCYEARQDKNNSWIPSG